MEYRDCCTEILDKVFENIFQLDFSDRTMRNLKSKCGVLRCSTGSIRMILDDALSAWIDNDVYEDDREALRSLFTLAEDEAVDSTEMKAEFRLKSEDTLVWYTGMIIRISDGKCWFCFNCFEDRKPVMLFNKNIEQKKEQAEWATKRAVVASRAGIIVADYDLKERRFWAAQGFKRYKFCTLLAEDFLNLENLIEFIHPDDRERFVLFYNYIVENLPEYSKNDFRILMQNENYEWNHLGVSLFFEDNQLVRIMFSLGNNDSEMKNRMELELSQKYLNDFINNTGNDIFTFRIIDDEIKIVYLTSKCSRYFGVTSDELHQRLAEGKKVDEILKTMPVSDEQFIQLIRESKCRFTVKDVYGKTENIIMTCRNVEDNYFVTIFNDNIEEIKVNEKLFKNKLHDIKITTFGFFDVFVDGKPVLFKSEKAKELFALLVDRKGGYVTSPNAISCLWEDEPVDKYTLAKYRKTAMKLKNTLEEYDVGYIVENVNGKRRLLTDEVDCDLLNYLSGDSKYSDLFKGVYLTNYSWGEITLASLSKI